ncbi:MAG: acyl-CoA dehydrogenase family protein [Parvibaculaceae bacterium]|nr:acyl-CoA dehydrogenase family protein [Parvibaculaceae bacterium]
MNFEHTDKTKELIARVEAFMDTHVYPIEKEHHDWNRNPENLWKHWPGIDVLKAKAKAEGLWNLFLPEEYGDLSPGLSNLEYAPLAEIMGRLPFSSEIFNCSAPDTGNMEVLAKFGSEQQKNDWLVPLMNGDIRSAYLMTEPQVASSDATNIETEIRSDGDDYVITGRKWWISGIMDPRCKLLLLMGKTDASAPRHKQQSTVIIPRDTPGVKIIRNQTVFGSMNSPGGEAELLLENVRIPKSNIVLGEGKGFEIAQGRLGPGRIHHCMRSIGQAQRTLEIMCQRVTERTTFGRELSQRSSIRQDIAKSYCEIEQARLLTLKAASAMDTVGNTQARDLIAAIKVIAPQMAQNVTDRAIQAHGGMGVSDDTPIAGFFTLNRFLRIADGPDEVHMSQLGKLKIKEFTE